MTPASPPSQHRSPQVANRRPSKDLLSSKIPARLMKDQGPRIGPYSLGKTLGVGSTGRVKLGTHIETLQKVAIKIIPKDSLVRQSSSESVDSNTSSDAVKAKKLNEKTEREITIMKLIQHPNVMQLYDVYETEKELYLILEHIEGGELFDYLVSKGRLSEEEALDFFQQITFGVDYCHRHLICHRDLKPENLLLNKDHQVKVADFGMASLQVMGKMLETSCGSPHYASPEIIKGVKYDGAAADVWSCGVILYALLTGNLPFDDENIRKLLSKVKTGSFAIPDYVNPDARDLICKMLVVDPAHRITMEEIFQHRWFESHPVKNMDACKYIVDNVTDRLEPTTMNDDISSSQNMSFKPLIIGVNDPDSLDLEVVSSLGFLGWTGNEKGLLQALLSPEKNIEKVFYNLLCRKKWDQFENYGRETSSNWDIAGGAKRRVGSISMSSIHHGDNESGTYSPSISRLDVYKSELNLVRQNSSSVDSLVDNSGSIVTSDDQLPCYPENLNGKLAPKAVAEGSRTHSPLSKSIQSEEPSMNSPAVEDKSVLRSTTDEGKRFPPPPITPRTKRSPPTLRAVSEPSKKLADGIYPSPTTQTSPGPHRKMSLFDDGAATPPISPTKKHWFKGFNYTPPEISLTSTHNIAKTAEAALLRLNDLHVKHQTDNYGLWRCKYEEKVTDASEWNTPSPNFLKNFTRKLSISMKGQEAPSSGSLSGTLVNISKSSAAAAASSSTKSVKFKMEVLEPVSSSTTGSRIVFTHQQGSYSLLQAVVRSFKASWPLGV